MKPSYWILIILIAVIITYVITKNINKEKKEEGGIIEEKISNKNKKEELIKIKKTDDYDIITMKLPNSPDPSIFGSAYWNAFHRLSGMIPMQSAREEGQSLIKFIHDIKNKSLEKGFYDKENYDFWISYLTPKPE